MKYITKNKLTVINCLQEHSNEHLTIEQINALLNGKVPLASLYRIIDTLVEEGMIRKYVVDNNTPACFQIINENGGCSHFHLLCSKCGKLIHLNCGEVNHLINHIENEHNFFIDISKVTLYGLCENCQENK